MKVQARAPINFAHKICLWQTYLDPSASTTMQIFGQFKVVRNKLIDVFFEERRRKAALFWSGKRKAMHVNASKSVLPLPRSLPHACISAGLASVWRLTFAFTILKIALFFPENRNTFYSTVKVLSFLQVPCKQCVLQHTVVYRLPSGSSCDASYPINLAALCQHANNIGSLVHGLAVLINQRFIK